MSRFSLKDTSGFAGIEAQLQSRGRGVSRERAPAPAGLGERRGGSAAGKALPIFCADSSRRGRRTLHTARPQARGEERSPRPASRSCSVSSLLCGEGRAAGRGRRPRAAVRGPRPGGAALGLGRWQKPSERGSERLEAGQRNRRAAETPAPTLPCDWGRGGGPPPPQGREGAEAGGRPRGSRRRLSRPGRGGPGKRPEPAARGPAERLQARAAGTRRRTARGGGSLQAAGGGRKLTCTWGVHRWRPY